MNGAPTVTSSSNQRLGAKPTASATLALLGGDPVGAPVKPQFPRFTDRARQRVDELLRTGPMVGLSKEHPAVGEAEDKIAAWHGVPHCLTAASGHASLHAALIGLEITGGAEVITTPYSWGASTSPILHNNAIPIYADVDPQTGLLDPVAAREVIGPRTEAILVTHLYGQPADMTAFRALADEHDLALIEDGSQAHGSRHRGQRVGSFGDAAGFSCMGGKLLATTEAGYMVTKRDDVFWKAVLSCQHAGGSEHPGRSADPGSPSDLRPFVDSLLYTYRIGVINAVLLTEQLAKLDDENDARARNRQRLLDATRDLGSFAPPEYPDGEPVFHMATFTFDAVHAGISRATYLEALQAEGVPAFVYIDTPLHRLDRLRPETRAPRTMWNDNLRRAGVDYAALDLPGCDAMVERSFQMVWNWIDDDEAAMDRIADGFTKVEEQLDALRAYEHARR
jgi:dTDP-4-amino-4,6-dideoxygalactose transaminase